ncbi:uncharacterized protein LOC141618944 [Silene latifolia]|uniref:uncharacterized protein LOC141618944 n=1 Tax=Silene latifolia TaxID=37657 RepID=UPI003D77999B
MDGDAEYQRPHLVTWDSVCYSKKEGGLGVKNAGMWNVATVGKLVNWIYTKADRLWVLWIDHIYMKGVDWSSYIPPPDSNWNWRNICKVKGMLATGFQGNHWISDARGYSINAGYQWLQSSHPHVPWYKDVWDSWNVPKQSVIGWLIQRKALNTRVKMAQLRISDNNSCVMCELGPETHAHTFSDCVYSNLVVTNIELWLQMSLQTLPGRCSTIRRKVWRVVRLSCWYMLWTERNKCRIDMNIRRPELLVSEIQKVAQMRIQHKLNFPIQQSDVIWITSLGIHV